MFGLRTPELLIILVIVVVLFGASRLPQLGKGLGEGIRSFKKSFSGEDEKPTSSGDAQGSGDKPGPKAS
jgi:sec-independent protein translocase protein TatA